VAVASFAGETLRERKKRQFEGGPPLVEFVNRRSRPIWVIRQKATCGEPVARRHVVNVVLSGERDPYVDIRQGDDHPTVVRPHPCP